MYKSGWLEQGGRTPQFTVSHATSHNDLVSVYKNYANTNYSVVYNIIFGGSGYAGTNSNIRVFNTNSFEINTWGQDNAGTLQYNWISMGYAA